TVDAPGVLTFTPSLGSYLAPGEQTLSVTFTPDDPKRYRPATKSLTIQVWGVDFGDAMSGSTSIPSQGYPALIADNGARHILKDSLRLGSSVDAERDGTPAESNAKGDNAIGKDEDGVRFPSSILSLTDSSASSLAAVASGDGYLTAWIDFNGDGDWSDPFEYVVQNEWVTAGAHVFSFEVPPNATAGKVAARVRLSSQSGLAPTGIASNGEVEDYVLEIHDSHKWIDVTPVGSGTISIFDFSATHIQYIEDGKVLARYPKSIWSINTARFPGSESDDTMDLDSRTQGELFLLGNAGAGNDRVYFKKGQNLDLTKRIQDSVTNIEMIDMKNDGSNLLRLDVVSASAVTDGVHALKIYADATDQIFFRGEWKVDSKIEINGEQFHKVTSGTVSVNLANGRMQQNPLQPLDVDLDGAATPLDVLSIINKLNIPDAPVMNRTNYLDVDGDGMISPLDVLTLINSLNDRSGPGGEGEAKEAVSDAFHMAFAADFEWEWNRKKR
ncbi:MAG: GEVED domain-containing protein, partial [Pirellula sp.]